ncbi:MAG: hypothetical protein WD002_09140 [Pseudomonadales bacterium]
MKNNLEEIGLAAVDKFITTWNSRDAVAWAGSLHFPHVRPSPFGEIRVARDAEEYISAVDFDRVVATGWDHSEWDYKRVLHTSKEKIHVVGAWSRYNKQGEVILTNPVVYIVTNVDGNWGVQSRFSADDPGDEDTTSMELRSFKLIETFVSNLISGSTTACAELLNYPHFEIGPGELKVTETAAMFTLPSATLVIDSLFALQAGRHSINLALDLNIDSANASGLRQAVVNITERDGHLGIQAWSLLDPTAIADQ